MPHQPPEFRRRGIGTLLRLGFVLASLALGPIEVAAQLTVKNSVYEPYDPERLIRDVFLGEGVNVTNITYDGPRVSLGYFEQGASVVGLDKGIILTTGLAATLPGGRTGADAASQFNAQEDNGSSVRDGNLEVIEPFVLPDGRQNVFNVSRYTITFVPTGDHVSFRYVFASEEYPDFVCSEYNDVFGFFISGPGFAGPFPNGGVNIAKIPTTTLPVTINNVNGGVVGSDGDIDNCSGSNGSLANTAYYRDNSTPGVYPVYNGMTRVLTAEADVIPCSTYTITIVIGDVRDEAYDSGVFLEAKSFSTPTLAVDVETIALGGDISEGCAPANLVFRLNQPLPVDRVVNYVVSGTAIPGLDYAPLPGVAILPAGTTELVVPILAYDDNLMESRETIVIDVQADICSTRRVTLSIVDRSIPAVPILVDTAICPGASVSLDATLPTTVDIEKVFSNNTPIPLSAFDVPYQSRITVTGVSPAQLRSGLIFKVCVDLSHGRMSDLDLFLFAPNGNYLELSTDNGGNVPGNFNQMCFSPKATNRIDDLTFGPTYTGLFRPEGNWSELWNDTDNPANGEWRLQITDDANGGFGSLLRWSIVFEPLYNVTYTWTPTAGLSCSNCPNPVATPTSSTEYTVVARDSYGCTETSIAKIRHFATPVMPAVSCVASFDRLTFSWPSDPTVVKYEVSEDGVTWRDIGLANRDTLTGIGFNVTRTLRVRATGHCANAEGSSTCTTQSCPAFTPTASTVPASCNGYADGQVGIRPNGGLAPYQFVIDGESNSTGNFNSLTAGTYTATVRDANSCVGTVTFTITEPAATLTAVSLAAPTACGGAYVASVSASGGSGGPYTYVWSDGQTGASASFLLPGTYLVDVADAMGCVKRDSAIVPAVEPLTASYAIRAISCAGADDGAVVAAGQGGHAPYTYRLENSGGSALAQNSLAPGTYRMIVTDDLNCSVDTSFTLVEPAALAASFTSTAVACNGAADGVLRVSVSNARGPISYTWPGYSSTSDELTGLVAGDYDVIATDSAGCSLRATGTIVQPSTLAIQVAVVNVACFGESSGQIRVGRTGGVAPFLFDFGTGPPSSDSVAADLVAGTYRVVVSDGMGCRQNRTVVVDEPEPLQVSHRQQPIRCSGDANGTVDLLVSGGTTPFSFMWNNGATTEDLADLASGTYSVVITDARGCTIDYTVTLTSPAPIDLLATSEDVSCFGYADGGITLNTTGGRTPYVHEWTGPNGYAFFGPSPRDLDTGSYRLLFRDAAGCRVDTSFQIAQPSVIRLTAAVVDTVCHGSRTGVAYVDVVGGTAPFSYRWSSGSTRDTALGLPGGRHTVWVEDSLGCRFSTMAEVPELPELRLSLSQTAVRCYRDSNGVAIVTAAAYGNRNANLADFAISWRGYPDSSSSRLSGLGGQQEALVTLTDARGCRAVDSIDIQEPPPLGAKASLVDEVACHGGQDGRATAEGSGGVGGLTYRWLSSGETSATAVALGAGEHFVVISDANACRDTAMVLVPQPDSLRISAQLTQVNCFAANTGRIETQATGGNVPYAYVWSHGPRTQNLDSLERGIYQLRVTDARGCERDTTLTVTRATEVFVSGETIGVTCAGDSDGSVRLIANGGNEPYTYRLGSSPFVRFPDFRFVAPGSYDIQVRDRDGCPSDVGKVSVEQPQPVLVEIGNVVELGFGDSVTVSGQVFNAVGRVAYSWTPADSTLFSCPTCASTTLRPLTPGYITLTVRDENGCEGEDQLQIKLHKTTLVRVPTGFTPNGDGRDDRLIVHGRTQTRVHSFQVFDRWGAVVYEAGDFWVNDESASWDGTARGANAPPGVYLWRAEITYLNGAREQYAGETLLIR